MGVLGYKLLSDLWSQKGRTLQIVLIIGLGAAAVGMIMTTRNLFIPGMVDMWQATHPAMINLNVDPAASSDVLVSLEQMDGVQEVEGQSSTTVEWRLSPEEDWKPAALIARADYDEQKMNKFELVSGSWPTGDEMASQQGDDRFFGISPTGRVFLRVEDREYSVRLNGIVYNPLSQPAYLGGNAQFFTTQERFEQLTGRSDFDQILITAPQYEEDAITSLADELQNRLEKQGIVSGRMIADPEKHFFQDEMDAIFYLLGVLGALSLALGLLLVYNTVNAYISGQVDQVGIMKAIGARTWQILVFYLLMIFTYGVMALLVALSLGIFGGWAITNWLVSSFGASVGEFEVSPPAVQTMIAITLLAPLLASLVPMAAGARVTVREAISTYGLAKNTGWTERLLSKARYLSRLVLITISNTFQHKWRVFLLEISLVTSGLIFMMVVSVQDSVVYTIRDVMFSILNVDATYILDSSEYINYIEDLTRSYPTVEYTEVWGLANTTLRPRGQPESEDDETALLFGVPLPTQLYGYQMRAGRWLDPADSAGVVLNQELAEEVGVGVGDWVTMKYGEKRERDWQVVGLVFDPMLTNSANVPREVLLRDLGSVGRASTVWVKTNQQEPEAKVAAAKALREFYEQNHVDVSPQRGVFNIGGDSTVETGSAFIGQFNFLVILLSIMAVIIGVVGSIALSGALSLSVMERKREIGVMRAIGASSWTVARLFIGEGLILGWLSWLVALPLSLPAGQVMVQALGQALNLEILYKYTPTGAGLWLVIITFLSILASWLPARSATRISVQASLAYQ